MFMVTTVAKKYVNLRDEEGANLHWLVDEINKALEGLSKGDELSVYQSENFLSVSYPRPNSRLIKNVVAPLVVATTWNTLNNSAPSNMKQMEECFNAEEEVLEAAFAMLTRSASLIDGFIG